MKKGLEVTKDSYLNMDQIVEWDFTEKAIYIYFNPRNEEGMRITTGSNGGGGGDCRDVPINEFHRIKRELNEYMGLGSEEKLSRVK